MSVPKDILDLVNAIQAKGEAVAVATIVRTLSATDAKAGARAVITADETISGGWIGRASAFDAVLRATREALADGQPRLISVQSENGLNAGKARDAGDMRSSQGAMDIFVEPMLPRPVLAIFGASPVAVALSDLARRVGFFVAVCAPAADHATFTEADRLVEGFAPPADLVGDLYLVISTQGTGDLAALSAAVRLRAKYFAVVGPRRKIALLKSELAREGVEAQDLEKIRAPAGLDIGAITPEEIALSIVAEMIEIRRRGQRQPSLRAAE
jgi:xanthine dehydrogenase accessory factor